ncbi:MAG: thioredoxin [Alphaproteobacteria bacterium]|nr:thioredoxin [Alphaproteobacteria bacterium]
MFFGKKEENKAPAGVPVFDATDADFEQSVLQASMERPVIVDFWAEWCGPCKQLGPVLEKAVAATNGDIVMAKVDIDKNKGVATALRIQSIPTVYAFFQGRPIDGFQGALPESQVKAFVDKLVKMARQAAPDAIDIPETLKAAAQSLADKNFEQAQGLYFAVLQQDQKNVQAYTGLVRTLIAAGQVDQAKELVEQAPPEIAGNPNFAEARTALELAAAAPAGNLKQFEQKLSQNPDDYQSRYDFALAQFAGGQKEEAMDNLLEIIRKNRGWNDEAARKQLLKFFEALGPADPLTIQGRRKLSSVLFS